MEDMVASPELEDTSLKTRIQAQIEEIRICERWGGDLDENFRCYSDRCGGRYRHPMTRTNENTDPVPCKCNQGHVRKSLIR